MTCDERRFLLQELRQAREFVSQHWADDLGCQFAAWVCQAEEDLTKLERQNELCAAKLDTIRHWCQEIIYSLEGDPGDPQKVLKPEHTPPRQR